MDVWGKKTEIGKKRQLYRKMDTGERTWGEIWGKQWEFVGKMEVEVAQVRTDVQANVWGKKGRNWEKNGS